MFEPPHIDAMFRAGTRYRWDDGTHSVVDVQSVGVLRLPTGRLVVQDPGWGAHPAVSPFIATVAPGHYPVTLSISQWDHSPYPDVASPMRLVNAARITVRDEPAVSWELALRLDQTPATLEDGSFVGFAVDSGAGCFLDASARDYLEHARELDQSAVDDAIDRVSRLGGVELPTDDPEGNIIVFRCGMGDGSYSTWIGRAENGKITSFVSDLELLRHSLGPETD